MRCRITSYNVCYTKLLRMSDVATIQQLVQKQQALKDEIAKVIIGQEEVVNQIVLSIFAGGHALLIGVPGLAKTLMVNTISHVITSYSIHYTKLYEVKIRCKIKFNRRIFLLRHLDGKFAIR